MESESAETPSCRARYRIARFAFLVGLATFLLLQGYFVLRPCISGEIPTKDKYHYIARAMLMENALTGSPLPLNDVFSVIPSLPPSFRGAVLDGIRLQYHPLHSAVLLSLHQCGISWDRAYGIVYFCGAIIILTGVVFFLTSLLQPGAAGCVLFFLASTVFASQGLHVAVPGPMTLGMALWCWGAIFRQWRQLWLFLPITIFAMCALHTFGIIWSALTVLLLMLNDPGQRRTNAKVAALCMVVIVAAVLYHASTVDRLLGVRVSSEMHPAGMEPLLHNIGVCIDTVAQWAASYSSMLLLSLLTIGVHELIRKRKARSFCIMGMVSLLLSVAAAFHIFFNYWGATFARTYIVLIVMITALVGQGLWSLIVLLVQTAYQDQLPKEDAAQENEPPSHAWFRIAVSLISVLLVIGVIDYGLEGIQRIRIATVSFMRLHSHPVSPESLRPLDNRAGPGGVLYASEPWTMVYSMANGLHDRPAEFYFSSVEDARPYVPYPRKKDTRFLVVKHPLAPWAVRKHLGVPLERNGFLTVSADTGEGFHYFSIQIVADTPVRMGSVEAEFTFEGGKRQTVALQSEPNGWFGVTVPGHRIVACRVKASHRLWIEGLRLNSEQILAWPWDNAVRLDFVDTRTEPTEVGIRFSTPSLVPELACAIDIINDRHWLITAKLIPHVEAEKP